MSESVTAIRICLLQWYWVSVRIKGDCLVILGHMFPVMAVDAQGLYVICVENNHRVIAVIRRYPDFVMFYRSASRLTASLTYAIVSCFAVVSQPYPSLRPVELVLPFLEFFFCHCPHHVIIYLI